MKIQDAATEAVIETRKALHPGNMLAFPTYSDIFQEFLYQSLLAIDRDFQGTWEAQLEEVRRAILVQDKIEEAKKLLESMGYQVRDLHDLNIEIGRRY